MNTELEKACSLLEKKTPNYGIPFEAYTDEYWQSIDSRISGYGPTWYRDLTKRFRLGGAYFFYNLGVNDYTGVVLIPRRTYAKTKDYVAEADPDTWLAKWNLFAFADGEDLGELKLQVEQS